MYFFPIFLFKYLLGNLFYSRLKTSHFKMLLNFQEQGHFGGHFISLIFFNFVDI